MKTLASRLVWARTEKKLSQDELAKKIGVSQGAIGHLELGTRLSSRKITALADALGVNALWLAEGKGDPSPSPEAQYKKVIAADASDERFVQIQKVKLRLSAGITGFHTDIEHDNGSTISIERRWIERKGFAPEHLVAVKVKGESMEPALYEDDVVLINTADTKLQDGVVYAVNYEGEAVIKRLMRDAGEWWLTSDNADQRKYHKKICRGNECLIVGRVVKKESENI